MLDFSFINSRLAVGKRLKGDLANLQVLKDAGITHIINLQSEEDDAPLLHGTGIHYCHAPTDDDHTPKPTEWFAKTIDFALRALAEPGTKIYVHCMAGISRSSSTAYAILRALGHSRATATWMLKDARPVVQINYMKDADRAVRELGYNEHY